MQQRGPRILQFLAAHPNMRRNVDSAVDWQGPDNFHQLDGDMEETEWRMIDTEKVRAAFKKDNEKEQVLADAKRKWEEVRHNHEEQVTQEVKRRRTAISSALRNNYLLRISWDATNYSCAYNAPLVVLYSV